MHSYFHSFVRDRNAEDSLRSFQAHNPAFVDTVELADSVVAVLVHFNWRSQEFLCLTTPYLTLGVLSRESFRDSIYIDFSLLHLARLERDNVRLLSGVDWSQHCLEVR